jgi:hypothetical protein
MELSQKASAGIYGSAQSRTPRRDSSLQSDRKFLLANAGNAQAHTSNARSQRGKPFGGSDRGSRSGVTGGAQITGFIELLTKLSARQGLDPRTSTASHRDE